MLDSLKKRYCVLILQLKFQSIKTKKEPYIKVDTRELNGVPSTKCLSYIHWTNSSCYTKTNLP